MNTRPRDQRTQHALLRRVYTDYQVAFRDWLNRRRQERPDVASWVDHYPGLNDELRERALQLLCHGK